jgi:hypothetical protein
MSNNVKSRITKLAEGVGIPYRYASDIGNLAEQLQKDRPGSEVGLQVNTTGTSSELHLIIKINHDSTGDEPR